MTSETMTLTPGFVEVQNDTDNRSCWKCEYVCLCVGAFGGQGGLFHIRHLIREVPEWLSWLGFQLLILAQVIISGF